MRAACAGVGRDINELELGLVVFNYSAAGARQLPNGEREAFTGSYDNILDDVKRYRDAGMQHAMIRLVHHASLDVTIANMEAFADRVVARIG